MRPSNRFLFCVFVWIVIGVIQSLGLIGLPIWSLAGALLFGVTVADGVAVMLGKPVKIIRRIPPRMALGISDRIDVSIQNEGAIGVRLNFFDGIPPTGEAPEIPWRGKVPSGSQRKISYHLRMLERGKWDLEPAFLEWYSPMGFWLRKKRGGSTDILRVYPNYEPTLRYALLALANQQSQMGIRPRNLLGMSKEFLQLREYQRGDVLSQIDWNATSRRLSLISREYEEQKNQSLILMLDTGRRMRAMDGDLAHFEYCLNAVLLVSYLALQSGDQVAILGFGGTTKWLPPVKGGAAMPRVLDHLYDYETTPKPSDFSEAAERLLAVQKRRAMVVVVSNLRGEDEADLLPAVEVLRERHLVIVTSIQEQSIGQTLSKPVESMEEAVLYGATRGYLDERRKLLEDLRSRGVTVVDTVAGELPVAISNAYLKVRKSA